MSKNEVLLQLQLILNGKLHWHLFTSKLHHHKVKCATVVNKFLLIWLFGLHRLLRTWIPNTNFHPNIFLISQYCNEKIRCLLYLDKPCILCIPHTLWSYLCCLNLAILIQQNNFRAKLMQQLNYVSVPVIFQSVVYRNHSV